jgi:Na+-driven multidrug efflux pump
MEAHANSTPTDSRFKRYLAGVGTGYVRMFAHVAVGLWLTPFTLRYLDREQYAIFSIILNLLTWLGLLDLGITAGLRIQAARLTGAPDKDRLNALASTAFFAQNVIVLAVTLVGIAMAFWFPSFFDVRPDLQTQTMWVVLLTVIGAAVTVGTQSFSALLIAHQQMHVDNIFGLLLIAIRTVLTVVLLKLGWGLYSLAIAHLAAKVVTGALAAIRTFRLIPGLQIKWSLASMDTMKGTISLGVWFTLGSLAAIVIDNMDSSIAAKLLTVETVTGLTLTGRFYELVGGMVWTVTETARPMLGQMLGANKNDEALTTYRQLFAISTSLAVVVALAVWAGNGCFVQKWVGEINYAGPLVDLALAFCVITHIWNMPNRVVLSANLHLRGQCMVRLLEGAVKLGCAIWFGKMWGLVGIVAATTISSLLTSMWLLPYLTARMFKRSFAKFIWEEASRVALLLVIILPLAYICRNLAYSIGGYPGAIVGSSLTGLCGLGLIWFLVLDKTARSYVPVRRICQKILPIRALAGTRA